MSGGPDSNWRSSPWQGDILPLNYHRLRSAEGQNRTAISCFSDTRRHQVGYLGKVGEIGLEPMAFRM